VTAATTAWRTRIVGHAEIPPTDLVPNPRNWRTHPPEQERALAGALSEVGWVAGVIVNRTTGNVVDGHSWIRIRSSVVPGGTEAESAGEEGAESS
jgi:hypothetical protein